MDFDTAFTVLVDPEHEGDFSDDPADPGAATRYGVSERVARAWGYTGAMKDLPLATAKQIARTEYWDPAHCDELPDGLRFDVFDTAYNTGVHEAIVLLQRAAGDLHLGTTLAVVADGVFGPQTKAVVAGCDPEWLRRAYNAARLDFYTDLPGWLHDGRGWTKRVAANLRR